MTQRGKPIAMLKSIDDSHIKTRVCQYEALKNGKGVDVAKRLVVSKIESQNLVLRKHGLRQFDMLTVKRSVERIEADSLNGVGRSLLPLEGQCSNRYFSQVFMLFAKTVRVKNRVTFKAYDGVNNTFNLAYAVLKWKVQRAIMQAKLEPYLGFLHAEKFGKPSLVCDFMELYRYLVDDFLIRYSQSLKKSDFVMQREDFSKNKIGQREYLNDSKTTDLTRKLYDFFGINGRG